MLDSVPRHLGALSNMKVLRTLDLENLPITGSVDALAELKVPLGRSQNLVTQRVHIHYHYGIRSPKP